MDVPADWEEVEPRSDGDSSDSSEVQLVERHENNPQSSVGPTAVRAPPDVRFEMQPAVFDAWLTLQRSSAMQTAKAPIFDILSPSWMKTDSFCSKRQAWEWCQQWFCLQIQEMQCRFQDWLQSWQPTGYVTLSLSKQMTMCFGKP